MTIELTYLLKDYEEHIKSSGLIDDLHEVKGEILACFCKPAPCHGDVLAKLAEEM